MPLCPSYFTEFRGMWERYCRDVTAIVYMVDVADPGTIELTSEELHRVLTHRELSGIPLLILLNKIDHIQNTLPASTSSDPTPTATATTQGDDGQKDTLSKQPTPQQQRLNEVLHVLRYDQIEERQKAFIPISCKTLEGIEDAISWLTNIAKNKN